MNLKSLSVVTIFLSLRILYAQQPVEHCPEINENQDVDMINEKLHGIWYLHSSILRFFEYDTKCTFINVTVLGEDHLHYVKHEFFNGSNDQRETFGTIEYQREGSTFMFYTNLLLPFHYMTTALNEDYWVLLACSECGFFSEEGAGIYVYVFTRLQYPSCELNAEIMDHLTAYGIDKQYVINHEQNNCPFC